MGVFEKKKEKNLWCYFLEIIPLRGPLSYMAITKMRRVGVHPSIKDGLSIDCRDLHHYHHQSLNPIKLKYILSFRKIKIKKSMLKMCPFGALANCLIGHLNNPNMAGLLK